MPNDDFVSLMSEGREILAASSHFADARLDDVQTVRFSCDNDGRVERRDRWRHGLGLRVRAQRRWGFAAVEGNVSWKETLARAERIAKAVPAEDSLPFADGPPLNDGEETPSPSPLLDTDRLRELVSAARDAVPDAKGIRLRAVSEAGLRGVVSSEGAWAIRPLVRGSLALSFSSQSLDGRVIPVPVATASSVMRDLIPDLLVQLDATRKLANRLSSAPSLEARECPIVLGPACTAYLIHEAFGHLCEADRVPPDRRDKLPLGVVIGPTDLEIWDRGDVAGASGSLPFDDEGVPCQPVALVSEGRWVGLLHSRKTAGVFRSSTTGNARVTSFRFAPLCRMRLTELRPGSQHPDDIISAVSDGLYLDVPYGGHIRGPRFHLSAVDVRRIRAGTLAEPYAGAVLVGEPLAILRQIEAIGNDQRLIDGFGTCSREDQKDLPVSMMAPTIRLSRAFVAPF